MREPLKVLLLTQRKVESFSSLANLPIPILESCALPNLPESVILLLGWDCIP